MNDWCLLQFALVHYFTKLGAGEYYLEELEETICMAEQRMRMKCMSSSQSEQQEDQDQGNIEKLQVWL